MSFEAQDCFAGIQGLLMGRTFADTVILEAIRKAVLELTENYKHPLLEATGPIVQFIAFQNVYAPNYFLEAGDANLDVNKVNSFFIYNDPYFAPGPTSSITNAGYELKLRSIDSIEVLLNIPGLPIYWARNNNQIYVGSMPDNTYYVYMRYQKEHPSAGTPNGFVDTTQILMANSWQEILEYAAAIRLAPQANLAGKRTELREAIYGDTKFQQTSGVEGSPGLIFQRTSQYSRDQSTTVRAFRLRMPSV